MVPDAEAPLVWEPEFSLGQLYNSNLFLLGYAQEVLEFCAAVEEGRQPDRGTLAQSLAIMPRAASTRTVVRENRRRACAWMSGWRSATT